MGFGMAVGQAHLLDDIISMVRIPHVGLLSFLIPGLQLELDPDDGPSIIERMTFTYGLGEQHGLYPLLTGAE
jgi:m7GpppX diphosphatase